jgi:hypothetical protein
MGKITKADIKIQKEVRELISLERNLTDDEREFIYENYNPAMDDNITENGVFFTPIGLAQDLAIFAPGADHFVDVCSGIGMLTYKLLMYDYYNCLYDTVTCIEYNPKFCEIGKKLTTGIKNSEGKEYTVNWICADVFDENLWKSILPKSAKFDLMISNPPYGKFPAADKDSVKWMNYKSERELMVVELCLKFARSGYFILPPSSCEFRYSGRPYYEEVEQKKVTKFRKENPDYFFKMVCDGIDAGIYREDWKGTQITTEAVHLDLERANYE